MIQNLKDLEKLLKLCRKQGVTSIKLADVEFSLGNLPDSHEGHISDPGEIPSDNPYSNFPSGMLSPEQLAFYSAGGRPEDDPENDQAN